VAKKLYTYDTLTGVVVMVHDIDCVYSYDNPNYKTIEDDDSMFFLWQEQGSVGTMKVSDKEEVIYVSAEE